MLLVVALLVGCDGDDAATGPGAATAPAAEQTDAAASDASRGSAGASGSVVGAADAADLELVADGVLTVCLDAPVPPFVTADAETPTGYTGLEIAVLDAVAARLDLTLVVEPARVERIQSGDVLADGRCDLGGSGLAVTERRAEQVAFTRPYYQSRQAVLVAADRTSGPTTGAGDVPTGLGHLDDAAALGASGALDGRRVGVRADSAGARLAARLELEEVAAYDDPGELIAALLSGEVDVVLRDLVTGVGQVVFPGVEVAGTVVTSRPYAFALDPDRSDTLREVLDGVLAQLDEDGTRERLVADAFGL